ncbi:hypothetical protein SCHPADRAFT_892322 [Schizopora paradoxa]|uniref:Uncharacterized protein n=1 Tax=Schizopora paradoxa TaxID=27342 RepID=A0A0H2S0G3_9AGAM|nr:hypothetical protein SCHPADRAFT_892322 [Schizopora paradoxa]
MHLLCCDTDVDKYTNTIAVKIRGMEDAETQVWARGHPRIRPNMPRVFAFYDWRSAYWDILSNDCLDCLLGVKQKTSDIMLGSLLSPRTERYSTRREAAFLNSDVKRATASTIALAFASARFGRRSSGDMSKDSLSGARRPSSSQIPPIVGQLSSRDDTCKSERQRPSNGSDTHRKEYCDATCQACRSGRRIWGREWIKELGMSGDERLAPT